MCEVDFLFGSCYCGMVSCLYLMQDDLLNLQIIFQQMMYFAHWQRAWDKGKLCSAMSQFAMSQILVVRLLLQDENWKYYGCRQFSTCTGTQLILK